MPENNEEKNLTELFLNLWKNNTVFRDNVAFLTQVRLDELPNKILPDFLSHAEDTFKYSSPPPPRKIFIC